MKINAEELREDIVNILIKNKDSVGFKAIYGQSMLDIVMDNFVVPYLENVTKERAKTFSSCIDLFCASFINLNK